MLKTLPSDPAWMKRALLLAAKGEGSTRPNPPVGAVLIRAGRIVGEGWHRKAGGPHAEIVALHSAGKLARGATLYVTLEPCSTHGRTGPCTEAIIRAGIRRVAVAVADPNPRHGGRGIGILRRTGMKVDVGVCRAEANALIEPFRMSMVEGRPFVTLKLAVSLDGRIADPVGRSRWISGPAARRWVRDLRRRCDAVMVGAGTARQDDPGLLVFDRDTPRGYRVVVSSSGRLPRSLRILSDKYANRTFVAVPRTCPAIRQRALSTAGATVLCVRTLRSGALSLRALMHRLRQEGFMHILCEGGGTLAHALVEAGCVDQYHFIVAGRLLGAGSAESVGGPGWSLGKAPALVIKSVQRLGRDILITARPLRRR